MNAPEASGKSSSGRAGVPSFIDDPAGCLHAIANRPPSRELWTLLCGAAASSMKEEESASLRAIYLRAVAQQLPAADMAVAGMEAAAGGGNKSSSIEFEMMRAQRLFEVLDAVSFSATNCTPRLAITQSGILDALLVHPGFKSPFLTQVHVEFCQIALMAEQYRFAARVLDGTWPRPATTLSVRHILRYFLLRGMIHVGCNDWTMAVRCFWTCLSVPSEVVSALAIFAWKKLVLVQCLQMEDDDYRSAQEYQLKRSHKRQAGQQDAEAMVIDGVYAGGPVSQPPTSNARGPMSLPRAGSNCLSRFLSMASSAKQQQQRSQQQQPEPEDVGHMAQDELGELSSQQLREQRQLVVESYPSMGVRVYMDLIYAFVAGDRTQFQSLLDRHKILFEADGNLGLVRHCHTAMVHRHVYQISRMFSVIPLAELASKLKMESAEATKELLQQLSIQKSSRCIVNHHSQWPSIDVGEDGMVAFVFETALSPDEFSGMVEVASDSDLEDNMQELIQLTKLVEKLDVSVATSPTFHALVRRANDAKMGGPRGVEEL